ncbi:MAG TPA: caspase family protein [Pyrinomonadaceae bacterium]|jgi:WD40 repeat protein|nr:caspase family protein [Pyrinomonadaceae bacterium]
MCGLLSGGAVFTVKGQERPQLSVQSGHPDWVVAVAFSPDGQTLASGGSVSDGTIRLWDVPTGIQLRVMRGHDSIISKIVFSDDGALLASSSGDKIILWDVATGAILRTINTAQPDINQLAFNKDDKNLVSGSGYGGDDEQTIKIWDVATGAELAAASRKNLFSPIEDSFSPDGKTLLVHDADPANPDVIKLLDVETRKERLVLEGHDGEVLCAAWSRDGRLIASGGQDNAVRLWDAATGKQSRTLRVTSSVVNSLAISPDGKRLASGNGDGAGVIKLWELTSGKGLSTIDGESPKVKTVVFDESGKVLAGLGGGDAPLRRWEAATGERDSTVWTQDGMELRTCGSGQFVFGLRRVGEQMAISLLDHDTGNVVRKFQGFASAALSVECSPDGKTLAVGGMNTVTLWDIATGKQARTLPGHPFSVLALAYSPDGKLLASGSGVYGRSGQVKLWDAATGQLLHEANLPTSGLVFSLKFSPDGKTIAAGSGRQGHVGAVTLFDAATLAERRTLSGHTDFVSTVAYSLDGKLIISGSWDRTLKLWDAQTGAELATLIASGERDWLVVTPDGLFDGSPAAWGQIVWRFSAQLRDVAPVELFFNEFYYPNLLADLFAGQRPRAAKDFTQKDRRQPQLKLTLEETAANAASAAPPTSTTVAAAPSTPANAAAPATTAPVSTRTVRVKIAVSKSPAGAQDVRLFRNGSLVRVWHGDVLKGQEAATLDATLPLVAGENRLTAYAFNRDNIKSTDAVLDIKGDERLRRKGTSYIVAVGVNEYAANPFFRNLKYAVADADSFASELKKQQERLGLYEKVEIIKLTDASATKANILAAFAGLAAKAQPEDAVIVYFAGHGLAQNNQFYLIPHDLGGAPATTAATATTGEAASRQAVLDASLAARGVSDRELERAFEGVDSGQIMMIIDACNSGQALGGERDGRGPMNSKGLAQLAYDKGMYILTAAQSFQAAQEVNMVGHGLLTFVLLDEGLRQSAADDEPQDGTVLVREWLDYATRRVPLMQLDKMKEAGERGGDLSFAEGERGLNLERRSGQRPRVFYRRELEAQPLVIALPATAKP